MKVLVTGSRGLIGSTLVPRLSEAGHEVIRLVRLPSMANSTMILWKPESAGILDKNRLEGLDAVIHLAGESIANGRWTTRKKARIRDSRVQSTDLLANTMKELKQPPRIFLSASAIGYYGNTGDAWADEDSPIGQGFLASVCRDWEAAAEPAVEVGVRVVKLRIGMVLSEKGGALAKILPTFRLGAGGSLGSGHQYMSWISIRDAVEAFLFALENESVRGPVNIVSPNPVTNHDFTHALGKALGRPTLLPVPSFVVRAMFGVEMAQALVLDSIRVKPTRLLDAGFQFQDTALEDTFEQLFEV